MRPARWNDGGSHDARGSRLDDGRLAASHASRHEGPQGFGEDTWRRFAEQSLLSRQKAWLTLSVNRATGDGGTCHGDSGGPHFLKGKIASITITGDTMCKATEEASTGEALQSVANAAADRERLHRVAALGAGLDRRPSGDPQGANQ